MRQIQENKESKEVDDNNSPPNRKLNFRACESLLRYERKHGQGNLTFSDPWMTLKFKAGNFQKLI